MSLLDAFNELKKSGFDAKKDKSFNGSYEELPDGEYLVNLEGATHNAKGDRDFLMITFTIVQGEYEARKESIFPRLETMSYKGNPIPPEIVAREIANLQLLGEAIGASVPDSCFMHESVSEAYEDLAQFFVQQRGKLLRLTKKVRPNKKNPKYPYKNYYFEKAVQPQVINPENDQLDPFKATGDAVTITDADLPFE